MSPASTQATHGNSIRQTAAPLKDRTPSPAHNNGDSNMKELRAEVEDWFQRDQADWDAFVTQQPARKMPGGTDLWDGMPAIDSKAVARTSPIFERYFGKPLDEKLIRAGGYSSVQDMLDDLIPKMQQKTVKK